MSKEAKNQSEAPQCECGCGEPTNGGRFRPGHDAKLKSQLIAEALGSSKRAATKLEALGWTRFLDAKRSVLAQKEAKAAKKAASAAEEAKEPQEEIEAPQEHQADEKPRRRGRPPKIRPENMENNQR